MSETLDNAKQRLTRSLGPGGYLNSQTTDTQYFNFSESQSSGIPVYCEEESQAHFDKSNQLRQALLTTDWYNEESQIPDWYHDNEECRSPDNSASTDESEMKAETFINPASLTATSSISAPSDQWGPDTKNQKKLEEILAKNHGDDNFVYNLVAQREDCDLVQENFRVLRKDNEKAEFSRKAIVLLRKAGIPTDLYRSRNPLRRGHLVVGFHMLQIAFELIRHGGQAHDIT
ncbi:hypothetical protein F5876DRAFT_65250 [Lentinula aff. lateritia]|uniref:Uncharacterized protein n=1 Tax=Lentinula aff. lateritia TaxID=2804960 RepID=A0ACC1U2B9_9AGAR|nr:hypothetical protein F5876DRAFT_65250 [Lentinula aff. lateritia]